MKTMLKVSLSLVAAAMLVGCASKTASQAATASNANTSDSAAMTSGMASANLTPAQQLQQTLATLPSKVYFDFNKYTLNADAQSTLQQNAAVLLKNPQVNVKISGYADTRGSAEYNLTLGNKRAIATYNYLTQQGVPTNQLCTVSYGDSKFGPNPTGDAQVYADERRAELEYNQTCAGAAN